MRTRSTSAWVARAFRSGASAAKRAAAALDRITTEGSPASDADTASARAKARKSISGSGRSRRKGRTTSRVSGARHGAAAGVPAAAIRSSSRRHLRGRRGAVRRALGERAADHAVEGDDRRVPRERGRLLVQRRRQHLDDRRAQERGAPRDRLVQDRRGREEVGARVDLVAQDLLRRHVPRRAHDEPGPRELACPSRATASSSFGQGPGQAEVEELHAVRREEDVRGLQVAVDDAGRVQGAGGRRASPARGASASPSGRGPRCEPLGRAARPRAAPWR